MSTPLWVIVDALALVAGAAGLWLWLRRAPPRVFTVIYRRRPDGALAREVLAGVSREEHRALHAPGPMTSRQWLGGLDEAWIEWHGEIGYGCAPRTVWSWLLRRAS